MSSGDTDTHERAATSRLFLHCPKKAKNVWSTGVGLATTVVTSSVLGPDRQPPFPQHPDVTPGSIPVVTLTAEYTQRKTPVPVGQEQYLRSRAMPDLEQIGEAQTATAISVIRHPR